jgi:ribose/xylose/arabinose/galactoside ABC-type transport system permease subunit
MTGEPPHPQPPFGTPPGPYQQPPAYPPPAAAAASAEPARDPLLPHLVWEGFLFLVALVLLVVLLVTAPSGGRVVQTLLLNVAIIGLLAAGLAFSLRTATPNLAAGSLSAAAGLVFVTLGRHSGELVALVVAVLVAMLVGAVLGGLAGGLSVPGWAVTFGGGLAVQGVLLVATKGQLEAMGHLVQPSAGLWFAFFLLVSVGGGVLWLVPRVRGPLSANRRSGDPGRWGGVAALLAALVGLGVSSLLAGLSGVLQAERLASASVADGTTTLSIAFGAVLLGGVSVFGRRAGVAGTFLGVMILATVQTLMTLHAIQSGYFFIVAAVAIVLGLLVSRLLETISGWFGRRGGTPAPGPVSMSDPR